MKFVEPQTLVPKITTGANSYRNIFSRKPIPIGRWLLFSGMARGGAASSENEKAFSETGGLSQRMGGGGTFSEKGWFSQREKGCLRKNGFLKEKRAIAEKKGFLRKRIVLSQRR